MLAGVRMLLPGVAILAVALLGHALLPPPYASGRAPAAQEATLPLRTPSPELDPALAEFVVDAATGLAVSAPTHPVFSGEPGPAYAALRSGGVRLSEGWGTGPTRAAAVTEAIDSARDALSREDLETIDSVELSIGEPVDLLDQPGETNRLTNVHRGVLGLQVALGERVVRFAPSQMIANNLSFDAALGDAAVTLEVSEDELDADAQIGTFTAQQLLVTIEPEEIVWMFRGNEVVPPEAVTEESVADLASSLGDWLVSNVQADGRMTYKYWPSRGEESTANNTIRQWMATVALGRTATVRANDDIHDLARQNIEYNLATFYETEGDLGLIVEADGDVKLGAVALAALALVEHPDRADFAAEESSLRRTVDALWQPDGSFRTFHRPASRNDNQNFYPGEALLLWSTLLAEDPDAQLLERFMRSFHYYRDWHRDQPNPAFVPWHTQAYVAAWEVTGEADLRDFVFEMNDWLLDLQQWDEAEYPDLRGRFHDPDKPVYGPPHASSDGVYLESLAAAYRLANAVDDRARAERYRVAIDRTLRDVMQLHFEDEVDLFYVSRPDPVRGGVRTTPYDNEIRVDNVQHNLMGILDVLAAFEASDYRDR